MAGERFDNINSENFLFGENNDLNYLSNKPVPVSSVVVVVVFGLFIRPTFLINLLYHMILLDPEEQQIPFTPKEYPLNVV